MSMDPSAEREGFRTFDVYVAFALVKAH